MAIASESREFDGLLRHARDSTPVSLPLKFALQARISGRKWLLAADGPGPARASAAARAALEFDRAFAIISVGFCGALDPALRVADLFVATVVRAGESRFLPLQPECTGTAAGGPLVSQDRVAASPEEKARLRALGASAVEMEAGAVASLAQDNGAPFYCVRVVSDEAATPMPLDFNLYRDAAGRFDRGRIARAAAVRPWTWPGLIKLSRNCQRASVTLGDFLADCRF